jgi:UDP-N-acetylglucosamine 2-epimerase (non-hydrolysing)
MRSHITILIIAGARPNFIKVAPLIKCIKRQQAGRNFGSVGVDYKFIHTGQHYDNKMSDIFFRELEIPPPDINLGVGSGSHASQTANIMMRFEPICDDLKPDWVVVVGDVNSTMACTLVASKMGTKIAHVEAGLRSFDRSMPEEINRLVTDALADLLLTPSSDADDNLIKEGIPTTRIVRVGNIMIDSLISSLEKARVSKISQNLRLEHRDFAYVTLHRPGNVDHSERLNTIMQILNRISKSLSIIFPMHPRTSKMLARYGITSNGNAALRVVAPVGYFDSLWLSENARFILTDSGGLQEEATFFRTPCLTLRPNTERPITTSCGSNRLTQIDRLLNDIETVLAGPKRVGQVPPLWDGNTSTRVLSSILEASAP